MNDDKGLKILKTVVIAMGIFLMLGIALLFYLVYQRQARPAEGGTGEAPIKIGRKHDGACPGAEVKVAGEGEFITSQINGHNLALTFAKPQNPSRPAKIVIVDYCSGQVLSRVEIGK